ncbi:MAG: acyltransferase [Anaerolineae bacterium]|nr:acyltransferase [Anaerolineae bacterium]
MKLTIGLAQIAPKLGDVDANLQTHLDYIDRAQQAGVDLLCFPELSLTGYYLKDLTYAVATQPGAGSPVFAPLLAASQARNMDIVVGFVDRDARGRFFIGAAYLSGGTVVHVHHKVYLPTYTLFDEGRYFAWGDAVRAFDTRFGRVGLLICEDFWHVGPPYLLWLDGADLLLMHSASPARGIDAEARLSSVRWVEMMNQAYAGVLTSFVTHCNRVGFEDGFAFGGGSAMYDPDGELIVQGPYYEEALVTAAIDTDDLHRARYRLPLLRDERTGLMMREMQRILSNGGGTR